MVVWPLDDPNATLVWNVVTWNNPVCVDDGAAKKEVPPEQQQPGGPADPWDLDSCCTDGCVCSTFVVLLHQTVRHVRREIFFFLRCHLWPSSLTAKPLIPAILAGGASSAVAADAALPARLQPDGHPVARPRPRPLDLPPLDAAPTAGPGRPDVVALVRPPALRPQGSLDFLELHFHQEITFVGQSEVPFL